MEIKRKCTIALRKCNLLCCEYCPEKKTCSDVCQNNSKICGMFLISEQSHKVRKAYNDPTAEEAIGKASRK